MRLQCIIIGVVIALVLSVQGIYAKTTSPETFIYNGHLLHSNGDPVTNHVTVRFSYWTSADFIDGDVQNNGEINTVATSYAGWQEEHIVQPNAHGYFSVEIGSTAGLPSFHIDSMDTEDLLSLHLQVEVKDRDDPLQSYELLDSNLESDIDDRTPILSVPFSKNADLLDQREIGTGSGDIAILQSGAVLDSLHIPGGTHQGNFTIDVDDSETSQVVLTFGDQLAKTLRYSISNSRFEFNDDVNIDGNLTITGLINGVDINSVVDNSHLRVSTGAGLSVNVAEGSYSLRGSTTDFAGSDGISLIDDATNYIYIGSGGLAISTVSFPEQESHIPLAQINAAGGSTSNLEDKRVFNADNRERTMEIILHPEYKNASYEADGSNNVGQLKVDHDNAARRNAYVWTSTRSTLQDYDIYIPITVPQHFVRFANSALSVSYNTDSASDTDNALDISVTDTAGIAVTLSQSSTGLASTSWATRTFAFNQTPNWTVGQDLLLHLRVYSQNNNAVRVGKILLQYVELPSE